MSPALHMCAQRNSCVFTHKHECEYTHIHSTNQNEKREKQPELLINYRNYRSRGKLALVTSQFVCFPPILLQETVKPQPKSS